MQLIFQVAQIVAPVFLLAAIGFGWVRRGLPYDVEFVSRLSMTLSIPCLIFMALVRSDVDPRLLRDTVLASLAAYLAVGARSRNHQVTGLSPGFPGVRRNPDG